MVMNEIGYTDLIVAVAEGTHGKLGQLLFFCQRHCELSKCEGFQLVLWPVSEAFFLESAIENLKSENGK